MTGLEDFFPQVALREGMAEDDKSPNTAWRRIIRRYIGNELPKAQRGDIDLDGVQLED